MQLKYGRELAIFNTNKDYKIVREIEGRVIPGTTELSIDSSQHAWEIRKVKGVHLLVRRQFDGKRIGRPDRLIQSRHFTARLWTEKDDGAKGWAIRLKLIHASLLAQGDWSMPDRDMTARGAIAELADREKRYIRDMGLDIDDTAWMVDDRENVWE